MQRVREITLANKEVRSVIEHFLEEDIISYGDYRTLNRFVRLLNKEGIFFRLEKIDDEECNEI